MTGSAASPAGSRFADLDLVVLDFETTGLSRRAEVVEVGAVRFRGGRAGETFTTLCRPVLVIPASATGVHGITTDMVEEVPPFSDVVPHLAGFLGDRILVGHHVRFDQGFLERGCRAAGQEPPAGDAWCTVRLSRRLFPDLPRHDLDSLCVTHGIRRGAAHRALDDACATADLLAILLERAEASGWDARDLAAAARPPGPGPRRPPRQWTEEERAVLEAAIVTGDRIRLEYVSRRGVRTAREVVPYAVTGPEAAPRLAAYDVAAGTTRTFRLDRVVQLRSVGGSCASWPEGCEPGPAVLE